MKKRKRKLKQKPYQVVFRKVILTDERGIEDDGVFKPNIRLRLAVFKARIEGKTFTEMFEKWVQDECRRKGENLTSDKKNLLRYIVRDSIVCQDNWQNT